MNDMIRNTATYDIDLAANAALLAVNSDSIIDNNVSTNTIDTTTTTTITDISTSLADFDKYAYIESVVASKGWCKCETGYYPSNNKIKSLEKDFVLFEKTNKLEDFLSKSSHINVENTDKMGVLEVGTQETMGCHKDIMSPLVENVITSDYFEEEEEDGCCEVAGSGFEDFEVLKSLRKRRKDSIVISFDSEWVSSEGSEKQVLSYQFATVQGKDLKRFLILSKNHKSIRIGQALGWIFDRLGISSVKKSEIKDLTGKEAFDCRIKVELLAHAVKADITSFNQDDKVLRKTVYRRLGEVAGGLVSTDDIFLNCPSLKKTNGKNGYCYPILLSVRDSMCHCPDKKSSLKAIGEVAGVKKVELPSKPINYIEHMDYLLMDNPELFFEYSSIDAVVALMYIAKIYGFNKTIPLTITSASARSAKTRIKKYLGAKTDEEFERVYRGLEEFCYGKTVIKKAGEKPVYLADTSLEVISPSVEMVQNFASRAFRGGYNASFEIGKFDFDTYDIDLKNAYPTLMCTVPDIDWEDPIKQLIHKGQVIDLSLFEAEDGKENPFAPVFVFCTFDFPENVKFPSILVNAEGNPIYPRTNGIKKFKRGVWACGPEIYVALKLGAKVICSDQGFILNALKKNGEVSHSLKEVVKQFVMDRDAAKKKYGKGSLEELILKTIVNSLYGKIAQNVIPKRRFSAFEDEMEDLGPSIVTNPVSACLITSSVRAILLSALNQIHNLGFRTFSCTTDGFISDIPEDKLRDLDLFGFRDVLIPIRKYLSGSEEIFEIKHRQNDLLNFTTRGNVSLMPEGVIAKNGVKTPEEVLKIERFDFESEEEYCQRVALNEKEWLMKLVLGRNNRVPYIQKEWTEWRDIFYGTDFYRVKKVEVSKRMDFDLKRKPVLASVEVVYPNVGGETYEIANFDTEPFETPEEFLLYRKKMESLDCLKTKSDLQDLIFAIERNGSKTRVVGNDSDYTKLRNCIIQHYAGVIRIPMFEVGTRQEKCAWLNSLGICEKEFTVELLKSFRKADRRNFIPLSTMKDILEKLNAEIL